MPEITTGSRETILKLFQHYAGLDRRPIESFVVWKHIAEHLKGGGENPFHYRGPFDPEKPPDDYAADVVYLLTANYLAITENGLALSPWGNNNAYGQELPESLKELAGRVERAGREGT